jgi:hypothetical protein
MRRVVVVGLLASAIVVAPQARAQSDVQLWTKAGARYRMHKRWHLIFEQHLRLDQNLSQLDAVMPEVDMRYRPLQWLRLETGYRWRYERDNARDWQGRHRVHGGIRLRLDLDPLEIRYRLQYQMQLRRERDDGTPVRHVARNALEGVWVGLSGIEPFVEAETFHRLDGGQDEQLLRKVRLTGGASHELGDHRLSLFYRLELLHTDPDEPILHIIGAGYRFNF